ncbi:hypothetical protein B0J13DRAFT_556397 [Dactylonectria estremocensis]|uniref:Secreted protein n=1 Tax=Dactylonectria estremocensis TaxID=1079267 RepID=A0A9P9EPF7_9HYPO|nr:hypothetical protein B0J13DRAFT_556397 [Dactylonectria estremocensis]
MQLSLRHEPFLHVVLPSWLLSLCNAIVPLEPYHQTSPYQVLTSPACPNLPRLLPPTCLRRYILEVGVTSGVIGFRNVALHV